MTRLHRVKGHDRVTPHDPTSMVISTRVRVSDRLGHGETTGTDGVPELSIVVPIFNEQETLPTLYHRITAELSKIRLEYEIVFIDDGSRDHSPQILVDLSRDPRVVVIRLSRNFGHQPAVSAGLDQALGRAVVVMDGDLQDPPEVISKLVERWRAGAKVVYAIRTRRKEGPLRRLGYWAFYRGLRRMSDVDIPLDAGDFCLMDRQVVDTLNRLPECDRFVRGLRAYVGFRQEGVRYERAERYDGTPKYTLRKLAALAADGVIGFSTLPLRMVGLLALVFTTVGVVASIATIRDALIRGGEPRTWLTILAAAGLVAGSQLFAIGIVAEYARRIFREVKGRPGYIVQQVIQHRRTPSLKEPA